MYMHHIACIPILFFSTCRLSCPDLKNKIYSVNLKKHNSSNNNKGPTIFKRACTVDFFTVAITGPAIPQMRWVNSWVIFKNHVHFFHELPGLSGISALLSTILHIFVFCSQFFQFVRNYSHSFHYSLREQPEKRNSISAK